MTVSIIIMQMTLFVVAMLVTVSSNNFIFLSLTPSFHKIEWKICKGIISGLHFTIFVNNRPKSRYFEVRNYIQIS